MSPYSRASRMRVRTLMLSLVLTLLGALNLVSVAPAATAADGLTFGAATTIAFPRPGAVTELTFEATAGEKLNFNVTKAALTSSYFYGKSVDFELVRPDGTAWGKAGSAGSVTSFTTSGLDASGSWTLRLRPQTDVVGSLTFTATKPVDQVVPVTPGTPVIVTYVGGGVDVRLTFPATAGRRFTLSVTDSQLSAPSGFASVGADVISPSGVTTHLPGEATRSLFLEDRALLDADGTWTVRMRAVGATGSQRVTVGVVADTEAAPVLGQPFTIGSAVPGQNGVYAFNAEAGRTLQAVLDQPDFSTGTWGGPSEDGGIRVSLNGPDGTPITNLLNPGWIYGEQLELPETGTYTVKVDPIGDTVGTAELTLRYPTVRTTALRLNRNVTTELPRGDTQRYTFTAAIARPLTLQITNVLWDSGFASPGASILIRRPDGTVFFRSEITGPQYIETPRLDAGGTWVVEVDPFSVSAGQLSFTAGQPLDQSATLSTDRRFTTTIRTPGQAARYRFTGRAGLHPTIDSDSHLWAMSSGESTGALVSLLRPDGSMYGTFNLDTLADGHSWGELDGSHGYTLDTSGTWTLVVDPYGDATGHQDFTVHQVADIRGSLSLGRTKAVRIATRGADAFYTFRWDGQGSLDWSTDLGFAGQLLLTSPDAQQQGASFFDGQTQGQFTGNAVRGIWTLQVNPNTGLVGTNHLTLSKAVPLP